MIVISLIANIFLLILVFKINKKLSEITKILKNQRKRIEINQEENIQKPGTKKIYFPDFLVCKNTKSSSSLSKEKKLHEKKRRVISTYQKKIN